MSSLVAEQVVKRFPVRPGLRALLRAPFAPGVGKLALQGVSLRIAEGQLVGLLGPNGAGKTTLTRLFAALMLPDEGSVHVADVDAVRYPTRARSFIGLALGEDRGLQMRLSGVENLRFFGALYGLTGPQTLQRIAELSKRLELTDVIARPVRTYSSGERARLALARAMLHRPRVLLLDEVTRALDPGSAQRIRHIIRSELVIAEGVTVLLTSHDLAEVKSLCDRVILLQAGRVRADGTYAEVEPAINEVFFDASEPGPSGSLPDGQRSLA